MAKTVSTLVDPLWPLKQAAGYLGLHPQELRDLARQRELPCVRRGPLGHYRFRVSALNAWADKHTVPARKEGYD